MAEELVLDMEIRGWVLTPLSMVMVLIGVLCYFVSKLMRSLASPSPDLKTVKEGHMLLTFSFQFCPNLVPDLLNPIWIDKLPAKPDCQEIS
jgi:uncharacterized membrane protein YqhA